MGNELDTVYEAARAVGCTSTWIRTLLAEQRLDDARKVDGVCTIPSTAIEPLTRKEEVHA